MYLISNERRYLKQMLQFADLPDDVSDLIIAYALEAFIETGAIIDICDRRCCNIWCFGVIRAVNRASTTITVDYLGWSEQWSENIEFESTRIAPLHSTPLALPEIRSNNLHYSQTHQTNIKELIGLGYGDEEELQGVYNTFRSSRVKITNLLVYWKLFGAQNLPPYIIKILENLTVVSPSFVARQKPNSVSWFLTLES